MAGTPPTSLLNPSTTTSPGGILYNRSHEEFLIVIGRRRRNVNGIFAALEIQRKLLSMVAGWRRRARSRPSARAAGAPAARARMSLGAHGGRPRDGRRAGLRTRGRAFVFASIIAFDLVEFLGIPSRVSSESGDYITLHYISRVSHSLIGATRAVISVSQMSRNAASSSRLASSGVASCSGVPVSGAGG